MLNFLKVNVEEAKKSIISPIQTVEKLIMNSRKCYSSIKEMEFGIQSNNIELSWSIETLL